MYGQEVDGGQVAQVLLLRVRAGQREVQRSVYAKKLRVIIGRDAYTDVCLDDPMVSRVHAVIYRKAEGFVLYDRSANGTDVNGRRLPMHILKDGDAITIGPFEITAEIYRECDSSFHDRAVAEGWTIDDSRTISLPSVA